MLASLTSFRFLRALSFFNSTVFTALLVFWLIPGAKTGELVFGWTHGWTWIVLSVLCLLSVRRREIPFWLAVVVVVIGGLGPYAGSVGFIVASRRGWPRERGSASGVPDAAAARIAR
jgi:hypothetical protein